MGWPVSIPNFFCPAGVAPLLVGFAAFAGGDLCGWRPGLGVAGAASDTLTEKRASSIDLFTNFGEYMPRVHCMRTAEGDPDWFWIVLLAAVTTGVVVWYGRIYWFWRTSYNAEEPRDRNKKLMHLANIFFWCAICGYVMSLVMFVWPAYRLLALFLLVLNIWSFRFCWNMDEFRVSLSAKRLERELRESLEMSNKKLREMVDERTHELQIARLEAERANKAKTLFLANMSHEIRTPLTSVLGYAHYAAECSDDPDRVMESMAIVERNGSHLLGLINDVLDLSRIESGEFECIQAKTDIHECLSTVLDLLRHRAESKGLALSLEGLKDVPRIVQTDDMRLKQVVVNLVGNAIKFTDSGSVTIDVSFDEREHDESMMSIRVSDTGIGVSPECCQKLFKPFVQADNSITKKFGGTGLGLTISKTIAGMLGGDVVLESSSPRGSVFVVTVRCGEYEWGEVDSKEESTLVAGSAPPHVSLAGKRVLLVEDSDDNRRLYTHFLRKVEAEVVGTCDGREAVEAVEQSDRFDLIVMDIQMPVLDGLTATREIREWGYSGPILALTANALHEDRDACLSGGCTAYLSKPASRDEFLATVSRLVGDAEALRAAS